MTSQIVLALEMQFTTRDLARERERVRMNRHMGLELRTRREGLGAHVASVRLDRATARSGRRRR